MTTMQRSRGITAMENVLKHKKSQLEKVNQTVKDFAQFYENTKKQMVQIRMIGKEEI